MRSGTERLIPQNTYFAELIKMSQNMQFPSLVVSYCSKEDKAKIYPEK